MILADNVEDREKALAKLLPMQRADFKGLFETMAGFPVTIRLLDPPLHEFLPKREELMGMAIAMLPAWLKLQFGITSEHMGLGWSPAEAAESEMSKVLIISSDCHAGALPATYNEYMPQAVPRGRQRLVARPRARDDVARRDLLRPGGRRGLRREGGRGRRAHEGDVGPEHAARRRRRSCGCWPTRRAPSRRAAASSMPAVRTRELDDDGIAGE